MNAAAPPSFLISATTCAPSFSRRPVRTTLAPARANSTAVALPIPDVPPVTSATLPENVLLFMELAFRCLLFLEGIGSVYEETDVSEVFYLTLISALGDLFSRASFCSEGHVVNRAVAGRSKGLLCRCHEYPGRLVTTRKPCRFRRARHRPERPDTPGR